jgi:hypothetical protein
MSRCATAWQRRPRPQRLRRRKRKHRKRENYLKIWFRKEQKAQTGVDGAGTRADPEGLADNDIHRLVRVTA